MQFWVLISSAIVKPDIIAKINKIKRHRSLLIAHDALTWVKQTVLVDNDWLLVLSAVILWILLRISTFLSIDMEHCIVVIVLRLVNEFLDGVLV